jgi:hypothetical protein
MGVKAVNPWEPVELFVNDSKVFSSAPIILLRGQANEVRLEKITPAIAKSISLGLVNDAGLIIGADPDFQKWVEVIDGRVTWTVTAQDGTSGNVHLVAFSREVDEFLDLSGLVVSGRLADELDMKIDGNTASDVAGWFYRDVARTVHYETRDNGIAFAPMGLLTTGMLEIAAVTARDGYECSKKYY